MFLKPTKTYNHKPKAQLYKRYTQVLNTYGLPLELDYVGVMILGTCYGVYDLHNNMTQVEWNQGISLIENNKCLILNYVNSTFYNPVDNKFYKLASYVTGETLEENSATFESSERNIYTQLKNAYTFPEELQMDKFFYVQDFDYIEENDTDISNTQLTKGATIKVETMNIRWDVENIPIEKDDYLIIDNKIYQVGDISISKKYKPMLSKTYRSELMRIV
jgi:hypothetical protein